jgi:hypothetical protein
MAIVGTAVVVVRAQVTKFEDDVNKAFKNLQGTAGRAGSMFGNAFGNNASKGLTRFQKESLRTYDRINKLIEASYYIGPAIAGAVSAIGALAAGLFAMGAQLSAALPTLIVFPSILTAFAQAAITAKLAFSGIGKAVQELNKGQKGADRLPGLLQAYANAQERVRNAQRRSTTAQERLNDAYKAAAERIQQLNFDAEDAAISQKRAAIALEEARESLKRVQDLPPNSKARREAELSFQEADLNYRRAVDRNKDLQKEQDEVTKSGTLSADQQVENSKEVLDAKDSLNEAIRDEKKATDELAKAWKAVDDARKGKGGTGGPSAMADLSKEAQEFAKFIASLQPEIKKLKDAAGKELFGPLEIAIQNLVDNLFPRLIPILQGTGGAFGRAAVEIAKVITEADNLKDLDTVGKTNIDTIEKFGVIAGNLYDIFITVLAAADPLIRRFTDWVVVLTDGWQASANAAHESGKLAGVFEYAGDVASQLGDIIGNLGGAFMNMGRSAAGPGSGGEMILDSLERVTARFKELTATMEADGSLEEYFKGASENFIKIGKIFVKIGKIFLKSADWEGTGSLLDSIGRAIDTLGGAMEKLSGTGPALGTFIEHFAKFIEFTTESGSIQTFFGILNTAFGALNAALSNPFVIQIFKYMAIIHAARLAFGRIGKVIMLVVKYITGMFLKLGMFVNKIKFFAFAVKYYWQTMAIGAKISAAATAIWSGVTKTATVIAGGFTKAMKLLRAAVISNPFVAIIVGIVALIALLVVAYKKFDWFRDFIDTVFNGIKDVIGAVIGWIADNWKLLLIILTGPFGVAVSLIVTHWDTIKNAIITVFNWVVDNWKTIFAILVSPITLAADGIVFLWGLIKGAAVGVFNWIVDNWKTILAVLTGPIGLAVAAIVTHWDTIKKAIVGVFNWVKDNWKDILLFFISPITLIVKAFEGLGTSIKNILKGAINFLIRGWNALEFKIPEFKVGPIKFGGFTLGLPNIPELAQGGVINPSPGGTLARIGEAGRAERVEPLDPDGLSKRDKAMISMLSGGGIGTINVYPSPGMNEVEIANLVSRQLAFHMRKGVL